MNWKKEQNKKLDTTLDEDYELLRLSNDKINRLQSNKPNSDERAIDEFIRLADEHNNNIRINQPLYYNKELHMSLINPDNYESW